MRAYKHPSRPPSPPALPDHPPVSSSSSRMSSPHYYFGGCRRRGAGLVLDRSAAASSGTTRRGGTLRGRPPQRLARALPRPGPHAPIPNAPSAGTGTGDRDSGRPRTDGTRCVVSGRRFVGVVARCVINTVWMCPRSAPVAVIRAMPRRKGCVLDAERVGWARLGIGPRDTCGSL